MKKEGYDITCVKSGKESLVLLNTNPRKFDIILLDRMMPEMDGITVLKKIRSNNATRKIPVIMQTAASNKDQVTEGLKAGAYYYLTKPFDRKTLIKVIDAAVSDIERSRTKKDKKNKESVIEETNECHFEISNFDEAEITALYLSNLYPSPDIFLLSIKKLMHSAIVHGNLGITENMEREFLSNGTLKEEIESRFKNDEYKDRKITINYKKLKNKITLTVKDQGDGFDWERRQSILKNKAHAHTGFGLYPDLRAFDEVKYMGNGNEICCEFFLSDDEDVMSGNKSQSLIDEVNKEDHNRSDSW